jgi:hypothetical protein
MQSALPGEADSLRSRLSKFKFVQQPLTSCLEDVPADGKSLTVISRETVTCSGVGQATTTRVSCIPTKEMMQRLEGFKSQADRREKEWLLTDQQALDLLEAPCIYCTKPSITNRISGIDRVQNDKPYAPNNAVSCCATCNSSKGQLSVTQWIANCLAVTERFRRGPMDLPDGTRVSSQIDACSGGLSDSQKILIKVSQQPTKKMN